MTDPTALFRALADETRLRCLTLLVSEGELCVCEMTQALGEIQPKVSRHLAALRAIGLVADRKRGAWVHYALAPDLPDWSRAVLAETARGVAATEPFVGDRRRLHAMTNRPARCGTEGNR